MAVAWKRGRSIPCRNRQRWPRQMMNHTARLGPSRSRSVPWLYPDQIPRNQIWPQSGRVLHPRFGFRMELRKIWPAQKSPEMAQTGVKTNGSIRSKSGPVQSPDYSPIRSRAVRSGPSPAVFFILDLVSAWNQLRSILRRNGQRWPRPVMKHTARSGLNRAQSSPQITTRSNPGQPELAPVKPSFIPDLGLPIWARPGPQ